MKYLNRHQITLYATPDLLAWVKSVKPDLHRWTLETINHRPTAYLIEEEDQNCHGLALESYFEKIVKYELSYLYIEKELWPKEITYELFSKWFTYQYHEEVCDLSSDKLESFDE